MTAAASWTLCLMCQGQYSQTPSTRRLYTPLYVFWLYFEEISGVADTEAAAYQPLAAL
jgi:hypothetical protein